MLLLLTHQLLTLLLLLQPLLRLLRPLLTLLLLLRPLLRKLLRLLLTLLSNQHDLKETGLRVGFFSPGHLWDGFKALLNGQQETLPLPIQCRRERSYEVLPITGSWFGAPIDVADAVLVLENNFGVRPRGQTPGTDPIIKDT